MPFIALPIAILFGAILFIPALAQGSKSEQLLLMGTGYSCHFKMLGLLPNGHGEDLFKAEDFIATQLMKDNLHISRLTNVIQNADFLKDHSSRLNHYDGQYFPRKAKWMIEMSWQARQLEVGERYLTEAFGETMPSIFELDDEKAERTFTVLANLTEAYRSIAYSIMYYSAWRQYWMDMHEQDGNQNFQVWYKTKLEEVGKPKLDDILSDISAATERALFKESPRFRPVDLDLNSVTRETWKARTANLHLPAIAQRALHYTGACFANQGIPATALSQHLMTRIADAIHRYERHIEIVINEPITHSP